MFTHNTQVVRIFVSSKRFGHGHEDAADQIIWIQFRMDPNRTNRPTSERTLTFLKRGSGVIHLQPNICNLPNIHSG